MVEVPAPHPERRKPKKKKQTRSDEVIPQEVLTNVKEDEVESGVLIGMLNMLSEVKQMGSILSAKPAEGDWELMSSIVDSGATIPVAPPEVGENGGYSLEESPASKAGVEYEVANGEAIPNLGQKSLAVMTSQGSIRGYQTQCANVTKPLQSVRSMLASKHAVIFDEEDSFVLNKITGELNLMRDGCMNYYLDRWIIPKTQVAHAMQIVASE